jgi:hypothetical protein
MSPSRTRRLAGLLAVLVLGMLLAMPAQAAPLATTQSATAHRNENSCVDHKQIDTWSNQRAIEARGFNFDIVGPQASAMFQHDLALNLATTDNSAYTASRMTEIDSELPIAQRVKCWQATPDKDVVVEFRVRFKESGTPAGLTENLVLWNAPLPSFNGTNPPSESAVPLTSIGVARTSALGTPLYIATVVQDLDLTTYNGLMNVALMPTWLDPGEWHQVKLTLSQQSARIEVAQAQHEYELVLEQQLPHPAEPLGFEFSVDNEAFPGFYVPVSVPDYLEIDYLSMSMVRSH